MKITRKKYTPNPNITEYEAAKEEYIDNKLNLAEAAMEFALVAQNCDDPDNDTYVIEEENLQIIATEFAASEQHLHQISVKEGRY